MKKLLSGLVLLNVLIIGAPLAHAHADEGTNLMTKAEFAARARKAEALAERMKRVNTYQAKMKKLQFNGSEWERRGPAVQMDVHMGARDTSCAVAGRVGDSPMLHKSQ